MQFTVFVTSHWPHGLRGKLNYLGNKALDQKKVLLKNSNYSFLFFPLRETLGRIPCILHASFVLRNFFTPKITPNLINIHTRKESASISTRLLRPCHLHSTEDAYLPSLHLSTVDLHLMVCTENCGYMVDNFCFYASRQAFTQIFCGTK